MGTVADVCLLGKLQLGEEEVFNDELIAGVGGDHSESIHADAVVWTDHGSRLLHFLYIKFLNSIKKEYQREYKNSIKTII